MNMNKFLDIVGIEPALYAMLTINNRTQIAKNEREKNRSRNTLWFVPPFNMGNKNK